jgi:ABC-type oligopeptide transport system substrate-binding subunit
MSRRFTLSLGMFALGASLLVAAAVGAGAASGGAAKRGGTLNVETRNDFDHIDPAYAYFNHAWQMEGATQLRLFEFPDGKTGEAAKALVPMGAQGFPRVSKDGKTYTFQIRPGFRFSNGQAVTAANYAYAINRILNVSPPSDAVPYLTQDVLGAKDVVDKKAAKPSGVIAKGNTLTITLTKVAPDLVSRLSMPFFAAAPLSFPLKSEVTTAPVHSAGPYYLQSHEANRTALAVRNPNYRGPRKGMVDRMAWTFGNSLAAQRLKVERGEADLGSFPPAEAADLAQRYGINRPGGRFYVKPSSTVWYLSFNHERPLFSGNQGLGNVRLKQAINFAVDRPQLARQWGYLGAKRTDQILPSTMNGFKDHNIYPIKGANTARASQLARGNTRGGKAILYTFDVAPGPGIAQVVQFNLKQIGVDVEIKTFARTVQHEKMATRGEPFDIGLEGWGQDYPDPANFINVLLDGRRIQSANNQNVAYFNNSGYVAKIERASRLSGKTRYEAYKALDLDLMKNVAPWAPLAQRNQQIFTSDRIAKWVFQEVYANTNLVATELK